MRIFLVGGGSGGHFYPLMAIADAVTSAPETVDTELYYIGPNPYRMDRLEARGIKFIHCPAGKYRKYFSILNFIDLFKTLYGTFVAIVKLYVYYPDVVMSKGSFTSVPVVIATRLLRIPLVIHESDSIPGTANKLASGGARYIAISYPETAQFFPSEKTALTGIPIRSEFLTPIENPHEIIKIPKDRPVLFVTGGSMGAARINNLILESLDELLPHFTIVHQVGEDNVETMMSNVHALVDQELFPNYVMYGHMSALQMAAAYQAADIVISRAGSTAIYEIAAKAKPAILIPIPETISHDQRTNAYTYARTGAASVMEEANLTDGLITAEITRIMGDPLVRSEMQTAAAKFAKVDAAKTIANALIGIGIEHKSF